MYVEANFDIVWRSRSITIEEAIKHGCTPEYAAKLIRKR
jgi:hypothetical protein